MLCRLLLTGKIAFRKEKSEKEAFCPAFVRHFRANPAPGQHLSSAVVYHGGRT